MRLGGRLAAAIDVLESFDESQKPIKNILREWGHRHRFAGSKDRAFIGDLVFDALRQRAFLIETTQSSSCVHHLLALLLHFWGEEPLQLFKQLEDDRFFPHVLTSEDKALFTHPFNKGADSTPPMQEWAWDLFKKAYGEHAMDEALALCDRAPVDLRVNSLKSTCKKVCSRLPNTHLLTPTLFATYGLRYAATKADQRAAHLSAQEGYMKGHFEIQDEGSQIVSLLSGVQKGQQVLDYCAGAGGKTLALAALMENKGQIFSYDRAQDRMKDLWPRLQRAGVRNAQIIGAHETHRLDQLKEQMDCVLLDAPCSGSGTWRRHPDLKWRMSEKSLNERYEAQNQVLEQGAHFVKRGGTLIYITCSMFMCENQDRIDHFLKNHSHFERIPFSKKNLSHDSFQQNLPLSALNADGSIALSPYKTGTDGFFITKVRRLS